MNPKVNNPQGVRVPDYRFRGVGYDLKTIGENAGVNTIFNRVKKTNGQARRVIVDTTVSGLSEKTISEQIQKLFNRADVEWLDQVIIVQNNKIVRVVERAEKKN